MQFLKTVGIYYGNGVAHLTKKELSNLAGSGSAATYILEYNNLPDRTTDIAVKTDMMAYAIEQNHDIPEVTPEKKKSILSSVASEYDVFESTALLDNSGWKYMNETNALPGTLRIPDDIVLPNTDDVIGGTAQAITNYIFNKTMGYIDAGQPVDPIIFNVYNNMKSTPVVTPQERPNLGILQYFNIPWGQVTLYSSLSDSTIDFPVYPEEYEDGAQATYDTMPDMLYQYEPWYTYKSSGPRSISLTFKFHRDMWSGDHRDGMANQLIRFCQAQCYPLFNGASVNTATVTLYIAGQPYITGILKEEKHTYSGPIGLDNMPLSVTLTLTFDEVSSYPLNYNSVMQKGLIG